MDESTATPRKEDSALGKAPESSDRYSEFTQKQRDAGLQRLRDQGVEAWSRRLEIDARS